jgi:hypothetical protein
MRVVLGKHLNFGNNVIRTMSSVFLAAVLGAKKLEGVRLPALGIATSIDEPLDELFLIKEGHVFPMEQILCALTNLSLRGVINNGFNQRLEYFSGQRDFWRAQFDRLAVVLPPISRSEVVVHIRAADILKPLHSSYYPLPLDFYDVIFEELGMTPVFIGQLSDDHPYLESLQSRYLSGQFIQSTPMGDFELLRRSHTKILSISSFSWLAGWLGGDDSRVVMPVGGLFNPVLRPDINLLPMDDERFQLRGFSPMEREQTEKSLDHFLEALSDASCGYPRVERSAYTIKEWGPPGVSSEPTRFAVPATAEEWNTFAGSVILQ